MWFKRLLGLSFILIFVVLQSAAQVNISGSIVDAKTGESMPFVHVTALPANIASMSNVEGRFNLLKLDTTQLLLVFTSLGYRSDTLVYQSGMPTEALRIEMQSSAIQLKTFEVEGNSNQSMEMSKEVSRVSINPMQLQRLPNLGEVDIFRSLQLLPGVSGSNESSSGLYVRGGTPDQNLILLDGINIYHVDHFFGVFSAFNAMAIKDVQMYKGGFESRYGGRLSSVVDLTAKAGNKNKPAANFNANMLSANLVLESPLPKNFGSFLIAARRSYTDVLRSPTYRSIFGNLTEEDQAADPGFGIGGLNAVEPVFFFYDLNAKLSLTPSSKDVISINYFQSGDNLDNSSTQNFGGFNASLETTDKTTWGNQGASLKWSRQWSPKIFNRFIASYSQYQSDYELTDLFTFDTLQFQSKTVQFNEINDLSLRNDFEYQISEKHQLKSGFWLSNNDISYTNVLDDSIQVQDQQGRGNTYAFYLQDSWRIHKSLTATAGMRFTYFDLSQKNYPEPRLSLAWQLSEKLRFKGAWGIYYQFVNRVILENIFGGSRDFWLLAGQNGIPVQFSQHYIAGLAWENKNYLIDVEFYRKNMGGLVEYSLRFGEAFEQEQDFDDLFFKGQGQVNGMDLLIQKKFGKLNGWLAYTLSQVEYNFPGIQINPFPALHDQRHEFKSVLMYSWKSFDFSSTFVYGTGRPYTAPVGLYELELLNGYRQKYIHVGDKNSSRLPDYHRLDLGISYRFNLGKIENRVGISVFNVYNRRNIKYRRFQIQNFDPESLRPIEARLLQTDIQLLGIVPNFFVNIKF